MIRKANRQRYVSELLAGSPYVGAAIVGEDRMGLTIWLDATQPPALRRPELKQMKQVSDAAAMAVRGGGEPSDLEILEFEATKKLVREAKLKKLAEAE